MTRQWPRRFAGLATLPVQDVTAAVDELERAVTVLGLKGAELDTAVNGANWDEPRFRPLFKAVEAMGAVLFFHPQPQHNLLFKAPDRYALANSVGVIVEDALIVATLIFGGILDACPGLKACIATVAVRPALVWGAWITAGRSAPKPAGTFVSPQRLPGPSLLRLRDRQRGGAPLSARPRRRRPRRARQ